MTKVRNSRFTDAQLDFLAELTVYGMGVGAFWWLYALTSFEATLIALFVLLIMKQ